MNKLGVIIRNYLIDYRLSQKTHDQLASELSEIIFKYIEVEIIGEAKKGIPHIAMEYKNDPTMP